MSEERHFPNGIAADEAHYRARRLQCDDDWSDEWPREARFENPRWARIEAMLAAEIATNAARAKQRSRGDFTPLRNVFIGPGTP